jgi:hypothetical protein
MAALNRSRRLRTDRSGLPHELPGELIISLTSYPPRFETLALTLACLCDQSMLADRIILWIAHDDIEKLPHNVSCKMTEAGVEIRTCEDIGPYKKLIPALEQFPDAYIATADDDVYYSRDWLETLVRGFDGESITCLRADRLAVSPSGSILEYLQWQLDAPADEPSNDLVPVGVRGILYPPHSLHPKVLDREMFMGLCPRGDDLWFYCMARLIGTSIRKVGPVQREITWLRSQRSGLWNENQYGGNDAMISKLVSVFGDIREPASTR